MSWQSTNKKHQCSDGKYRTVYVQNGVKGPKGSNARVKAVKAVKRIVYERIIKRRKWDGGSGDDPYKCTVEQKDDGGDTMYVHCGSHATDARLEELGLEIAYLTETNKILDGELKRANEELKRAANDKQKCEDQYNIKILQDQAQNAQTKKGVASELEVLRTQNEELQKQLRKSINTQNQTNATKAAANAQLASEFDEIRKIKNELTSKVGDLESQLAILKGNANTKNANNDELQRLVTELTAKLKYSENTNKNKDGRISELEAKIQNAQTEHTKNANALRQKFNTNTGVAKQQYEEEIGKLRKEVEVLKGYKEQANSRANAAEIALQKNKNANAKRLEDITSLENKIKESNKNANASKNELQKLQIQYDKMQVDLKNCEQLLFDKVKLRLTKEEDAREKLGMKAQGTPKLSNANVRAHIARFNKERK